MAALRLCRERTLHRENKWIPMEKTVNGEKLHNDQKGFSLVEIIIALAVLAIIAVPICHSFVTAARTNAKARKQASANSVAENVMEGINAYTYEDLVTQFTTVSVDDFLISENCNAKSVVSGWSDAMHTVPGNTMVYQIQGVDEDVYSFDVRVTVDAAVYMAAPGEAEKFNDQELAVVTNYNAEKDYLFVQNKEDEITAYQTFASRSGSHSPAEFAGKVKRMIRIVLEKEDSPQAVRVSTTVTYTYVGTEGWIPAENAVYTKNYGTRQYITDELLRNMYICYIPNYAAKFSSSDMDEILIENEDNIDASVFLIKQKDDSGSALESKENQYVPTVRIIEGRWEETQTGAKIKLHTNYKNNLATGGEIPSGMGPKYFYSYKNSDNIERQVSGSDADALLEITEAFETQKKNRMYQVTVEVYESGAYDHFTDGTEIKRVTMLTSD